MSTIIFFLVILFSFCGIVPELPAQNTGHDYSNFRFYRAEVFNATFLRQPSERFQGYPFRSYGGGVYLGGYSDHFPTIIYLIREK